MAREGEQSSLQGASITHNYDVAVLFCTRALRLFSYGSVGVLLALYIQEVGFSDRQLGLLLMLVLLGDAAISLLITVYADRAGRRKMLLLGCFLKVSGGIVFAYIASASVLHFCLLALAGTIGIISPTGNEVGPFGALEQTILAEQVSPSIRTTTFAYYNLVGYVFSGTGSVEAGGLVDLLRHKAGLSRSSSFRVVFLQYSGVAVLLAGMFAFLSPKVEAAHTSTDTPDRHSSQIDELEHQRRASSTSVNEPDNGLSSQESLEAALLPSTQNIENVPARQADIRSSGGSLSCFGLSLYSSQIVLQLSGLVALDSFGGSLISGTLLAYYFAETYSVSTTYLGGLLFAANVLAGLSSLGAGWIASKIGLVNTMVVTHLPSNVFTILIPVMPNLQAATAMVFLRFSISQMDKAPRQSYVAGVVRKDERAVTIGITNIVKSLANALGPVITGWLVSNGHFPVAFFMSGSLKILYDIALLWSFSRIKPDSETSEDH